MSLGRRSLSGLADAGLNLHAVFDLAALPEKLRASLGDLHGYRQLIAALRRRLPGRADGW